MDLRVYLLVGFSIVNLVFPARVQAAVYGYHPDTTLKLMGGFDPQRPTNQGLTCLGGTPAPIEGGTVGANFNATVVKSREELLRILHVDASLSGRYGLFSGGASFSYDNQYSFEEDSLTWAIYADSDFGRVDVPDAHPNKYAQDLIKAKKWTQFKAGCGTEVVVGERHEGSVAAIFSIRNLSQSQKSDLEAKATFGASGGIWSASAQANYHKFVSEASQLSTIKVTVAVVGGQGIQVLSGLAADYDDLQKITDVIRTYIAGLNFQNSIPTQYFTTDWAAFGYEGPELDVTQQSEVLGSLYILYQDSLRARERAHQEISLAQQPEYQDRLTADQVKALKDEESGATSVIGTIISRADTCRKSINACKPVTDISMPDIYWPTLQPVDRYTILTSGYRGCQPPPGQVSSGCYTQATIDVTYDAKTVDKITFYPGGDNRLVQMNVRARRPGDVREDLNSNTWKSEIFDVELLGKHNSALMVVTDKSSVDQIYHLSLQPD